MGIEPMSEAWEDVRCRVSWEYIERFEAAPSKYGNT